MNSKRLIADMETKQIRSRLWMNTRRRVAGTFLLLCLGPWSALWAASPDVPPSIQEQPKGASVIESMDVTFQVSARGTPPLSFQWRKDGKNLPGTQSEELKLTDVDVKDSGRYSVVVTNAVGSVTSSEATLIVGSPYALFPVAGPVGPLEFPSGSADGPGPEARFNAGSAGLTLDTNGNVFVADAGNYTVRKIAPAGTSWTVTTLAGRAGIQGTNNGTAGAARFWRLEDVAVDRAGNLIVADVNQVRKITPSGEVSVLVDSWKWARDGEAALLPPISPGNNTESPVWGPRLSLQNFSMFALANAPDGNIYGVDADVIWKITPEGNVSIFAGGGLGQYAGLGGAQVRTISGYADGKGRAALFKDLIGIAFDSQGNAFVIEAGSFTIRKITPDGTVTTFAGKAGAPGLVNGALTEARFNFNYPSHITVDRAGNLYVIEPGGGGVRRVTTNGVVSTLFVIDPEPKTDSSYCTPQIFPYGIEAAANGDIFLGEWLFVRRLRPIPKGAPIFLNHPQSQTVAEGGTIVLSVTNNLGRSPLNYQWQKDGTIVSAGRITSLNNLWWASYTITNAQKANSGKYSLFVTNSLGEARSCIATVVVSGGSDGSKPKIDPPTNVTTNGCIIRWAPVLEITIYEIDVSIDIQFNVFLPGYRGLVVTNMTSARITGLAPDTMYYCRVRARTNNGSVNVSDPIPIRTPPAIPGLEGSLRVVIEPADAVKAGAKWRVDESDWKNSGAQVSGLSFGLHALEFQEITGWIAPARQTPFIMPFQVENVVGTYLPGTAGGSGSGGNTGGATNTPPPAGSIAYTIATLAGSDDLYAHKDEKGSLARFYLPGGIAVDATGAIYVADSGNRTIRKITLKGNVTTFAGQPGLYNGSADGKGLSAGFHSPSGLAIDGLGNLYLADGGDHTIRKITPDGTVSTIAGLAGKPGSVDDTRSLARFDGPTGVAVDSQGNLYVADSGNHTIRKIASSGLVSTLAGLAKTSGRTDGTGTGARFFSPQGMAVDGAGNVYVADRLNHAIRKITPAGVVSTIAGLAQVKGSADGTLNLARFDNPWDVAVDKKGNLFVTDGDNRSIRLISAEGWVATIAGARNALLRGQDGTGDRAWFRTPRGIAVDSSGLLYLTDSSAHSVRLGFPPTAPPLVIDDPEAQSSNAGATVIFRSTAVGPPPLSYQWRKNGANIAGATVSSYTITSAQSADVGTYSVTVSNAGGSTVSRDAILTVNTSVATSITSHPQNQTVTAGQSVTFNVVATGNPAPAYQWRKNGVNIAGASTATYTIPSAQASDAGSYSVIVANVVESVTSAEAAITINPNVLPPWEDWKLNPANGHYYKVIATAKWKDAEATAISLGAHLVTIRSAAEQSWLASEFGTENRWIGLTDEALEGRWAWSSGEPVTFTNWHDGEPNDVGGVEDYAFLQQRAGSNGLIIWRWNDFHGNGTLTSIIEWIPPSPPSPTILTPPLGQTVTNGANVIFSVMVSGLGQLSYQWQKDGSNLSGATNTYLFLNHVSLNQAGRYAVTVTNLGGRATSSNAVLTVNTSVPLSITSHPQNQTVTAGQSVTFNVVATGNPAPAYQWRKNGVNIAGASTATYTIPSAQASDAGSYSVFVSNSAGSKTSMSAVLTVETVPVLPTINVLQPSDAIIASTANSPASEGVANAIDHSRAKYLNFDMANDAIPSGFIVTPAVGPTIISGISIQSANDSPERDPRSFTLDGSNDADASYARGTWTTIYSNANVPDWSMTFPGDTRYQTQTFYFSNTTAYKSYRWMVQHTQGPSLCCMQIAELGLLTATQSTVAPVSQVSAGISASPSVGGSVSGGGTVNSGGSATVTATPAGGYTFANWTENGIVVSTSPSYTFTAIANRTLVANFAVSNPAPAPNTSKLLAYWDFNTAGNSAAALDKVKSYSAALQNGVVYTADGAGASGKKGDRGVDFGTSSGVNRQIRISTAAFTSAFNAAAAKDQVTVSYWIKWNRGVAASSAFWFSSPKSLPDQRGMQAHSPYGNNVIYFDTAGCCTSNTQRIDKNVTTSLPNFNWQTWHHFAFVKSNAVKQIWIDGTLFHSGAGASPLPTDFNDFLIGHSIVPASDNVRAVMDDFAIYGSALSAASVKALSSGTSPLEIESSAPQVAPSITAHPQSQSVSTGQSVTFSVQATGTPAPTYQWQKDNVNLPGQTSSMLTLSNVKEFDAGRYTVVVSNAAGSLTSGGAILTISSPPGPQTVVVDGNTNPFASGQVKVFGNNPQPWKSTGGVNNSGYLALTDATASQSTVVVFPDYLNGAGYQGFHFSMDVRIGNGTTDRTADGLSLSLARSNDPVIGSGTGFAGEQIESGTTTGLAISFDTWSGNALPDGLDVEGLIIRADNKTLRRVPLPTRNGACGDITSVQTGPVALTAPGSPNGLCWERVEVDLSSDSRLTIKYKGKTLVDRLETGYSPSARSRWILGARTGGANENHHVDNIRIGPSESVDPPPAPMTPPTLSDIADQTITQATAVTVALTVRDAETAPEALTLTAASSNLSLLPLANITFGGTGTERTVTLAPNLSQSGAATVTITVGDGSGLSTRKSFVLTVTPQAVGPPTTGGGTVQFNNRLPGSVDARVTMQDGTGVGSGWTAQLAVVNSTGTVTPVTPTTTFRTSTAAATGYVNPIDLPVPNTVPGSTITLVLRAYNGAAFESSTLRGQSQPINVVLGGVGSPPSPPNALAGLSGFVVAAPASPSAKPFVERQLPSGYSPGKTLTVLLKASPPNDANVYDVDDSPPNRWAVGNVSAGGSYDGVNNKVKWGPFFDGTARTLTYEVTPLVGESGAKLFAGSSAIDGARVPVAGASTLDVIVVKLHPADNNPGDSQITIAELTAYGGAWQNGSRWPTDPNPIPIDYVTVAGNLWKNGEFYTVDPSVSTAPQWWVNLPGKAGLQGFARSGSTLSGGSIVGSLSPLFVRGETLLVQISVQPATGVSAYAVQDQIPQGWTVTQVSEGGAVDPSAGQVKWGPFLDSRARQLHYTLGAPTDSSETAQLQGAASFDGSSNAITGQRQSRASIRLGALQPLPNGSGQFELPATGRLGGKWILQASSDLLNWVEIGTTVNTDGNIRFRDLSHALTGPRFYRAVAQ